MIWIDILNSYICSKYIGWLEVSQELRKSLKKTIKELNFQYAQNYFLNANKYGIHDQSFKWYAGCVSELAWAK